MGIILRLDKETGEFQEKRFDPKAHVDTFFKCVELKNWNTARIPEAKMGCFYCRSRCMNLGDRMG